VFQGFYFFWTYEHEYRIIYAQGDGYYERPATITGVIFGPYMDPEDRETLTQLLPNVKRELALLDPKEVSVDIALVVS